MESTTAPEIAADPRLREIVRAAEQVLERVVGKAPYPPRALWRLIPRAEGGPLIELELRDQSDVRSQSFTPGQLADDRTLFFELSHLWGQFIAQVVREAANRFWDNAAELSHSPALAATGSREA